jgi:Flagellar hook-length control protein FliK
MSIVIAPNIPSVSAPSAPPTGIVLQPGQVVTAHVVQILGNDQVQIAIGSVTIEAATQVPLQVGQSLQLQVSQTPNGIGLAIVNQPSIAAGQTSAQGAATPNSVTLAPSLAASLAAATTPTTSTPANPLTPAETLAVTLAAQTAATQQTSLASLFANLDVAAGLNLPPLVQQAVAQVLAQQTNLDQNLTGSAIKQAFQSSGLFLESAIAAESGLSSSGGLDLKAALIVLRQTLSTALTSATGTDSAATPVTTPSQPGATATAAPQGSAPEGPASPAPEPTSEPASTGSTSAPATATTTQQTTTALASAQAEQATGQASALPVTITAEAVTQEVLAPSPSIVPQAGSTAATPAASTQGTALAIAQEILELTAANQAIASTAMPADAVARAAASSAALNLLQEVLQASPLAAASPSQFVFENSKALSLLPVVAGERTPASSDPEFARTNLPPPPVNGALPSAQPVAPATLSAHAPLETALQHLLSDTDGAIARQTLLQIASLPGQTDPSATRLDASIPRWNFEIPFATPQGTAMAQFEISRDGGGRDVEGAKQVWRARFSLNVEPAGPVHALVSLNGDRTSVRMWAERPATASQLRAGLSQLSQALSRAELTPGEIVVRDGAPSQVTPAVPGHFLDRAS